MKNRVRAIISQDERILLIHRVKNGLEYWVFPGGGVEESDESLESALQRECDEELGVTVAVGEVFNVEDFTVDGVVNREYFMKCEITGGKLGTGSGPEYNPESGYKGTYNLEWLPLDSLINFAVKPEKVRDMLHAGRKNEKDCN